MYCQFHTFLSLFEKRSLERRRSFFGTGSEKKWCSIHSRPQGEWDRVAELMMIKFGASGHPVFRATSPLSGGTLRSEGGGKLSIHFCTDSGRLKLIAQIFIILLNTNNIVKWNTVQKQCRLGLYQDPDFAGDLEDSKSISGGTLCFLGSHSFVPRRWMCKKQTSVSHSPTELEIISLDAGLRIDGIPALDLWDPIVTVHHGNTNQSKEAQGDYMLNAKENSRKDWSSGQC